jgi:hypothetical protein
MAQFEKPKSVETGEDQSNEAKIKAACGQTLELSQDYMDELANGNTAQIEASTYLISSLQSRVSDLRKSRFTNFLSPDKQRAIGKTGEKIKIANHVDFGRLQDAIGDAHFYESMFRIVDSAKKKGAVYMPSLDKVAKLTDNYKKKGENWQVMIGTNIDCRISLTVDQESGEINQDETNGFLATVDEDPVGTFKRLKALRRSRREKEFERELDRATS